MTYKATRAGFGLALALLTTTVQAGTWQLGLPAESSRSPFIGDQQKTEVLPLINYLGDRFSYFGGEIQYRLNPADGDETYLLGQVRSRQFYSGSSDFVNDLGIEGVEERDPAFELGLGFRGQAHWGQYVLQALFDATSVHEGYELSLNYSYPKQLGRWLFEPALGLQLQSGDLVNYYHGVRDSEAQDGLPAYTADQAVNALASLTAAYTINNHLLAIAGMEQLTLDTSITDSPIIEVKHVRKVYLGLIYTF